MEIKLDETYLIKTDNYNFKVGYYTEREKNGEIEKVFNTEGYYTNLKGAIRGYINGEILSIKDTKNKDILKEVEKIYLKVKEIYKVIDESKDIHIAKLREVMNVEE
jgi:hypothetical protein